MSIVITARHIRDLFDNEYTEPGVLVIVEDGTYLGGPVQVMPFSLAEADDDVVRIVITDTDARLHCGANLDGPVVDRLAADLTRDLAENA